MGVCPDLISMIADIIHMPRSRVRINSGYSGWFHLKRGVRQGDPLSCLLYAFSIEPLGTALRRCMTGLSLPGVPAAKVMMYTDDTNLFASANEDIPGILQVLDSSSLAIGSLFNHTKTLVKPVGSLDFQCACHDSQTLAGFTMTGASVLGPDEPVRILGVWVGHTNRADGVWRGVIHQVKFIISQWKHIGASFRN
jgi:Reverse transcriptase (RNA-dependent DNA polymerase)